MSSGRWGSAALIAIATTISGARAGRQEVPAELLAVVGTYRGEWTMTGLDAALQPKVVARWTDVSVASDPKVEGGMAFVLTHDEMKFEGATKPRVFDGREGWFLNADGSLGDYFLESFGQITRMHALDEGVMAYAAPASPQDLASLGLPKGATARHVLVKVVTHEEGAENHRITRITTAQWKDAAGHEQCVQFTSLQGRHRRDPE